MHSLLFYYIENKWGINYTLYGVYTSHKSNCRQNEVTLSNDKVRGLNFLADIFVATIMCMMSCFAQYMSHILQIQCFCIFGCSSSHHWYSHHPTIALLVSARFNKMHYATYTRILQTVLSKAVRKLAGLQYYLLKWYYIFTKSNDFLTTFIVHGAYIILFYFSLT